jgi:hypothetical protein
MILKKLESDVNLDLAPTVIEHIQPKQCCLHPHEGCTPTKDFVEHEQKSQEKKEFWKRKIEELKLD